MAFLLLTYWEKVFIQHEKGIRVHKQHITSSYSFEPPHSVIWQKIKQLTLNTKIEKKFSESPYLIYYGEPCRLGFKPAIVAFSLLDSQ